MDGSDVFWKILNILTIFSVQFYSYSNQCQDFKSKYVAVEFIGIHLVGMVNY